MPHFPPRNTRTANSVITRRLLLTGIGASALSACSPTLEMPALELDDFTTGSIPMRPQISIDKGVTSSDVMYASFSDEGFVLPAIPYQKVQKEFRRQIVVDPTGEQPGTIVVRLQRALPLLRAAGRRGAALRRRHRPRRLPLVGPRQHPVRQEMADLDAAARDDRPQAGAGEMAPRPAGRPRQSARRARACTSIKNNEDTGYRVHGSPEWWTIGQAMSSGCVRMINQDVIDLFNRVSGKTPIVVG